MNSGQTAHQQEIVDITKSRSESSWMHQLWTLFKDKYEYFLIPVVMVLFLSGWELIIASGRFPEYLLPKPTSVWQMFLHVAANGELANHIRVTLTEALVGFGWGLVIATVFGYILGRSPAMENLLSPYILAAKSIDVFGLAPLFLIWFGGGIMAKSLVVFMMLFFPMLINTIVGIRSVNVEQRELMRSFSASPWQVFTKLEIPSALPLLLGGIKIGLSRSMMGAIVAEYLGSREGLGFIINMGTLGIANAPLTFVGIFAIVIITLILYSSVGLLERIFLSSRQRNTA
jgi:NitT/TauT family transport system permease protein